MGRTQFSRTLKMDKGLFRTIKIQQDRPKVLLCLGMPRRDFDCSLQQFQSFIQGPPTAQDGTQETHEVYVSRVSFQHLST